MPCPTIFSWFMLAVRTEQKRDPEKKHAHEVSIEHAIATHIHGLSYQIDTLAANHMPPYKSYTSPFPPLRLDEDEALQLEELAHLLIAPVIEQLEDRLQDPHQHVDPSQWKVVKEHDDVHVYKERSSKRRNTKSDRSSVSAQTTWSDPRREMPHLLMVGTIQGNLYDTMYAVTNPTTDSMRIKSAYIQDGLIDSAILARLKEPTMEDPFQSLSIKWSIQGQPFLWRTLLNDRDHVYLEATGLTRLPRSGEVVGYQLLHSIEFPQIPCLPGCLRGKISIVGLYRQRERGVMEMFAKGFVDPKGRIARTLVVKSAAQAMLSTWRTIDTAHRKKLAYALHCRQEHEVVSRCLSPLLSSMDCSMCAKTPSPLTCGRKGYASQCQLCARTVCTSCRVKKKLASITPGGWLDMKTVSFCVACVNSVTRASAFDIAIDELVDKNCRDTRAFSSASSLSIPEIRAELASDGILHPYCRIHPQAYSE